MTNKITVGVIGDLTAVYCARSGCSADHSRRSINYKKLNDVLLSAFGIAEWSSNVWYTLFDPKNKPQESFVQGLKDLGWNIKTAKGNKETRYHKYPTDHRFDAQITYQLATSDEDHIVLVTDSMDIVPIIRQMREEDPDTKITVAFFADALDKSWWNILRDENRGFDFLDLDEVLYQDES
jgi:hypothetical protein